MFAQTPAFGGFSVDDVPAARRFYGEVLGLRTSTNEMGILTLHLAGGRDVIAYPKGADHVPATFTILNFPVPDLEAAVTELAEAGIETQRSDWTDERGIMRQGGTLIAWFTDPAGNVLSVIEIPDAEAAGTKGGFTHAHLDDVADAAPGFGLDGHQEVRFATEAVEALRTGLALQRIRPGMRPPFAHRHRAAEEVYVVTGGGGRIALDGEVRELRRLDAVRVSPDVVRAFEAGPDGLELLAFGPRHVGDGEVGETPWPDDRDA